MIIELLFNIMLSIIDYILSGVPDITFVFPDISVVGTWWGHIAWFFPEGLFFGAVTYVFGWIGFKMFYSPIKWLYQKIPGVN